MLTHSYQIKKGFWDYSLQTWYDLLNSPKPPPPFELVLGLCHQNKSKYYVIHFSKVMVHLTTQQFLCDYAALFDLYRKEIWISVLTKNSSQNCTKPSLLDLCPREWRWWPPSFWLPQREEGGVCTLYLSIQFGGIYRVGILTAYTLSGHRPHGILLFRSLWNMGDFNQMLISQQIFINCLLCTQYDVV